jgi:hypothetical protein
MSAVIRQPKGWKLVSVALALFLAVGCGPVRLISPYDQLIDEGVTEFHTKITTFVGKITALSGKPEGTYDANTEAYPEFAAELSTLKLRAHATEKNELTENAIAEVVVNVENLRKLHKLGGEKGLSPVVAQPAMAAIDVQCESILKLEIAKKRGDNAN